MHRSFLSGFVRYIGLPLVFVAIVIALGPGPIVPKVIGLCSAVVVALVVYVVIWRVALRREDRASRNNNQARDIARRGLTAVRRRDIRLSAPRDES
ncbi:hypothetical protein GCM10009775_28900 [Microbacterium aoyamense]|uniref:DUF4229 domain-containing protein n=1 Tax=Microbacterium aoyamense TaxID=344166 RepID=A0ABP5B7F5_9MICO